MSTDFEYSIHLSLEQEWESFGLFGCFSTHISSFCWVVDSAWSVGHFYVFIDYSNVPKAPPPLRCSQNKASAKWKSSQFSRVSDSREHHSHVVWQYLGFQLLAAHLRFPLMRGSCRLLRPLQQQIASRLPLQTNRSAQTHREGGFWFMSHQRGHILWLKGRRVRLIFGDGWYLWQVILEGGSPLLHRSPPLPCLMDITRCPRRNLQFWFSPKQTSPDVKA